VDQRYWDLIVQVIAQATVDYEAPEAEELDWLVSLLEAYLDFYKPASEEDEAAWKSHVRMELPVKHGGTVLVHATHLARWSTESRGQWIRPREMAYLLRRYGAENVRVEFRTGGYVHRRYWALPASLLGGQDEGETDFTGVATSPLLRGEVATLSAPFSTEEKNGVATSPLMFDSPSEDPEKQKGSGDVATRGEKRVLDGLNPVATSFEGSGDVATAPVQGGKAETDFTEVARLPLLHREVATTSAPSSTEKKEGVATLPLCDDFRGAPREKEKGSGDVATGGEKRVLNGINPVATSPPRSGDPATSLAQGEVDDDWF
jgi:hypothetical protein